MQRRIDEVEAKCTLAAAQAREELASGLATTEQTLRSERQYQVAAINQSIARLVRKINSLNFLDSSSFPVQEHVYAIQYLSSFFSNDHLLLRRLNADDSGQVEKDVLHKLTQLF